MKEGIACFVLLIVLKDSKAETDIINEPHATPKNGLFVDPRLLKGKPDKEMTGNICLNDNSDAFGSGGKGNIPE